VSKIKVSQEVNVYELDGNELPIGSDMKLNVYSHWNRSNMIVLQFKGENQITVLGNDLSRAIDNAMNVGGA
jgi:hypothetical protein